MRWLRPLLVLAAIAVAIGLGACGDDSESVGSGTAGADFDLSGLTVTVGSKEFTEQLILGHITRLRLEAAGAQVRDQTGLEGSTVTRNALESGDIDMYWEYTGTGWITHLKETEPLPDSRRQYEAVAERDLAENGIRWLEPAPFVNTYALAVSTETAQRLGVATISDFKRLVAEKPDEATLCVGSEFSTRDDGLPGIEMRYDFQVPDDNVNVVQDAVVYSRVDKGSPCNFGSVFSTDGRIGALDLTVLEDDMSFFPKFNPALTVRKEVVDANPDLVPLAAELAEHLDEQTMIMLNARVDVDGEFPEDVARDWLRQEGLIG